MKKIQRFSAILVCLTVLLCALSFSVSAASASISVKGTPDVGKTITVSVSVSAKDDPMYSNNSTLFYDNSMLRIVKVNNDGSKGTGSVQWVDTNFGENGGTSAGYSVEFEVLKAGKVSLQYTGEYGNYNWDKVTYKAPATTITAKTPVTSSKTSSTSKTSSSNSSSNTSSNKDKSEMSSDTNLSALKINGATLAPSFTPSRISYVASCGADVQKVTVSATASDTKSKIAGIGTYDVTDGKKISITVTAESGAKKTYTVTLENPGDGEIEVIRDQLEARVDDISYHIATDLSNVTGPAGLEAHDATFNGADIQVFSDKEDTFSVYYLIDDKTGKGDYFTYLDQRDEFEPLHFLKLNGVEYIFVNDGLTEAPAGYTVSEASLGNGLAKVYYAEDETYKDFGILYCFANGRLQYYRYDFAEKTIQRAPDFPPKAVSQSNTDATAKTTDKQSGKGVFQWFMGLSASGKAVVFGFAVVVLCLLLLIIILPISAVARSRKAGKADTKENFTFDTVDLLNNNNDFPGRSD